MALRRREVKISRSTVLFSTLNRWLMYSWSYRVVDFCDRHRVAMATGEVGYHCFVIGTYRLQAEKAVYNDRLFYWISLLLRQIC
jgi:hypothetical protein